MKLSLVKARLKAASIGLRTVGGAADLEAAQKGAVVMPGAFLLNLGDDAGPDDEPIGGTDQQIVKTIGVVLCLANRRDSQGEAALDDLEDLRKAVRDTLVGWVPDATTGEPMTFAGGRLQSLDKESRLWWMDEFRIKTYYRSA
ncbi:hypothetical protein LHU53_15580 [Rhodoferax sp. U2-2l]|uniref:phage tail terminator protein n=1 Tax=Rhodoferax sp. U2-2l TaxID=2884000 RepID=UPI001D0AF69E|nr:hypothetical protein [Rhodoferax sp. U2-2l]MCB8748321.1 hypothetical protein [Rhodoferax sp. U2-2l]